VQFQNNVNAYVILGGGGGICRKKADEYFTKIVFNINQAKGKFFPYLIERNTTKP
jgi:hypothetical protein